MMYSDGTLVQVGDKVKLWDGVEAVVVCSFDTGNYLPDYPKEEWAYIGAGILLSSPQMGLMHPREPDEDFELIERLSKPATET